MRGVNKLIVEIKDTDSEYFDRAILFLKPEKLGIEQSRLNESAEKLLEKVKGGTPHGHGRAWLWVTAGAVVAAAMLLGWILLLTLL